MIGQISKTVALIGECLTFFGLLYRDSILLIFLGGRGERGFWSTALLPQVFGHIVNVVQVFGRAVVFDVIHTNGPTLNLMMNTKNR